MSTEASGHVLHEMTKWNNEISSILISITHVVHREMIEHCLNCYGKRFTENGTEIHLLKIHPDSEDSLQIPGHHCDCIPSCLQMTSSMHSMRIKCVGVLRWCCCRMLSSSTWKTFRMFGSKVSRRAWAQDWISWGSEVTFLQFAIQYHDLAIIAVFLPHWLFDSF